MKEKGNSAFLRRLMSAALALAMAFPGALTLPAGAAAAEENRPSNADLEETVFSREDEESGSQASLIEIMRVVKSEEFQALMEFDDVREVIGEGLGKVLGWLRENREVTMKIFRELGFTDPEIVIIARIWDYGKDMEAAGQGYLDSEDGRQLVRECEALWESGLLQHSFRDLAELGSSRDLEILLQEYGDRMDMGADSWTEENRGERHGMLESLAKLVDQSAWMRESLPKLAADERFGTVTEHLGRLMRSEALTPFWEAVERLLDDSEAIHFLAKMGYAAIYGAFGIAPKSPVED